MRRLLLIIFPTLLFFLFKLPPLAHASPSVVGAVWDYQNQKDLYDPSGFKAMNNGVYMNSRGVELKFTFSSTDLNPYAPKNGTFVVTFIPATSPFNCNKSPYCYIDGKWGNFTYEGTSSNPVTNLNSIQYIAGQDINKIHEYDATPQYEGNNSWTIDIRQQTRNDLTTQTQEWHYYLTYINSKKPTEKDLNGIANNNSNVTAVVMVASGSFNVSGKGSLSCGGVIGANVLNIPSTQNNIFVYDQDSIKVRVDNVCANINYKVFLSGTNPNGGSYQNKVFFRGQPQQTNTKKIPSSADVNGPLAGNKAYPYSGLTYDSTNHQWSFTIPLNGNNHESDIYVSGKICVTQINGDNTNMSGAPDQCMSGFGINYTYQNVPTPAASTKNPEGIYPIDFSLDPAGVGMILPCNTNAMSTNNAPTVNSLGPKSANSNQFLFASAWTNFLSAVNFFFTGQATTTNTTNQQLAYGPTQNNPPEFINSAVPLSSNTLQVPNNIEYMSPTDGTLTVSFFATQKNGYFLNATVFNPKTNQQDSLITYETFSCTANYNCSHTVPLSSFNNVDIPYNSKATVTVTIKNTNDPSINLVNTLTATGYIACNSPATILDTQNLKCYNGQVCNYTTVSVPGKSNSTTNIASCTTPASPETYQTCSATCISQPGNPAGCIALCGNRFPSPTPAPTLTQVQQSCSGLTGANLSLCEQASNQSKCADGTTCLSPNTCFDISKITTDPNIQATIFKQLHLTNDCVNSNACYSTCYTGLTSISKSASINPASIASTCSQACSLNSTCSGGSCIYKQSGSCYVGKCLDGSNSCNDLGSNCGYVSGCSGQPVSCNAATNFPNGQATTPIPTYTPCYQVDTALGMIKTDPVSFVNNLFDILLSLSGGIALLIIIYNGYRLMISRGNPDAIKKAREGITSGIIGIIFAILSIAILQTIGVDILHLPGFGN